MNDRKRYLIIMLLGAVMNFALYSLASRFGWPVWLDMTGTALAALLLEPAAGLTVGLVNNFCLAIMDNDAGSLLYYAVSAAVALIVGLYMRRDSRSLFRRIVTTLALAIVAASVLSALLTLWRTSGVPDAAWEVHYYSAAMAWGWPKEAACFFGIFIVKIYDVLASAAIVAAVCGLLPKKLKSPAARPQ